MPSLDPSDIALLDTVQRQTLRYFWDFAHPACGLARERSNAPFDYGPEVVATGGTGFGVLAIITGTERGWITRAAGGDGRARVRRVGNHHGHRARLDPAGGGGRPPAPGRPLPVGRRRLPRRV